MCIEDKGDSAPVTKEKRERRKGRIGLTPKDIINFRRGRKDAER